MNNEPGRTLSGEYWVRFMEGMPKGTAQQKGERIAYARDMSGRLKPYIQHYKSKKVSQARREFEKALIQFHPPLIPKSKPIALTIILYFNVKSERKKWGHWKPTKPDADNYCKELIDAMAGRFFENDAQICDLRIMKRYAEKATIYIRVEELAP